MNAITDKKLHDKIMKEKKLEVERTIELDEQSTYEKKKQNNTGKVTLSRKQIDGKKRTDTKNMGSFEPKPKNKTLRNRPCSLCNARN